MFQANYSSLKTFFVLSRVNKQANVASGVAFAFINFKVSSRKPCWLTSLSNYHACFVCFAVFKPTPLGLNILVNPSFEQPLGNDPLHSWSCQGETDDPRGGIVAQYSRDHHGDGKYSGLCLARLSEWAGPGQYIG